MIPITTKQINNEVIQTVNARELHAWLGNKDHFSTWIKSRIEQYDFVLNQDYVTYSESSEKGRPSIEYAISLDMGKELSMVERTEKGKEARQYFIDCERKAKLAIEVLTPAQLLLAQAQQAVIVCCGWAFSCSDRWWWGFCGG